MSKAQSEALIIALLLACWASPATPDTAVGNRMELSVDAAPGDGTLVTDFDGSIWSMPAEGGTAVRLIDSEYPLSRPRWSPDGRRILYHAQTPGGLRLYLADADGSNARPLPDAGFHDQDAAWHPDGERIIFSSARNGSGLDLWEMDLPTGLAWRVTSEKGDETQPAWSTNGRHLVYVRRNETGHALMLRRHGEPATELVASTERLAAPSWRPDGSLVTYQLYPSARPILMMAILSDPPLLRAVEASEALTGSPVSWVDRMRYLYTDTDGIRIRGFGDRRSRPLSFNAIVESLAPRVPRKLPSRHLDLGRAAQGRLVVRAARLFDGLGTQYREGVDIVIEDGRVAAIENQAPRPGENVVDLGDLTVLPGLIDTWSPPIESAAAGARLLAWGVTTVVADPDSLTFDPDAWRTESVPGPRLFFRRSAGSEPAEAIGDIVFGHAGRGVSRVDDTWRERAAIVADNASTAETVDADIVIGLAAAGEARGRPVISNAADGDTPGLSALLEARQSQAFGATESPGRRFQSTRRRIGNGGVAAGGAASGLAPGQALHAELLALQGAGLTREQALHAAGRNAARLLGLEGQIGTITVGAAADLILVAGDPLRDLAALRNVVAVVIDGRVFSLISLLERGVPDQSVE